MAEEFSPEERLLRLIRGKKKDDGKPAPAKAEGTADVPSTSGIQNIKYTPLAGEPVSGGWGYFEFFNLALLITLLAVIIFYIFDLAGSQRPAAGGLDKSDGGYRRQRPPISAPQDAKAEDEIVPFSTYAEAIGKRELFKPPKSEIVQVKEKPSAKISAPASDMLKNLSLIGIMGGERPQAIIEDKKDKKTYFLNKGQTVNEMTVDDILDNKVILDFEGEKFDLVL